MSVRLTGFIDRQISQATIGFSILAGQFTRNRQLRFAEQEGGAFIQLGNDGRTFSSLTLRKYLEEITRDHEIHIELKESHFLIRQLSLPVGARSYIDGIIRSQIDRLMPWKAEQTLFGWAIVQENKNDLAVCIAATKKTKIDELLIPFNDLRTKKIYCEVTVKIEDQRHTIRLPINHLSSMPKASSAIIRRLLSGFLVIVFILYISDLSMQYFIRSEIDAIQLRLENIKREKIELTNKNDQSSDEIVIATDLKRNERPVVEVLNELARILPDNTYLTAITIEKRIIHIEGISTDVTSLPALIDSSDFFTNATFSAATTRQQAGDSFRIDAIVTGRGMNKP